MLVGDEVSCPGRAPTAAVRTAKKVVVKVVEAVEVTQGAKAAADTIQAAQDAAKATATERGEAAEAAKKKRDDGCSCYCVRQGDGKTNTGNAIGQRPNSAACRSECMMQGYPGYRCGGGSISWYPN